MNWGPFFSAACGGVSTERAYKRRRDEFRKKKHIIFVSHDSVFLFLQINTLQQTQISVSQMIFGGLKAVRVFIDF